MLTFLYLQRTSISWPGVAPLWIIDLRAMTVLARILALEDISAVRHTEGAGPDDILHLGTASNNYPPVTSLHHAGMRIVITGVTSFVDIIITLHRCSYRVGDMFIFLVSFIFGHFAFEEGMGNQWHTLFFALT